MMSTIAPDEEPSPGSVIPGVGLALLVMIGCLDCGGPFPETGHQQYVRLTRQIEEKNQRDLDRRRRQERENRRGRWT